MKTLNTNLTNLYNSIRTAILSRPSLSERELEELNVLSDTEPDKVLEFLRTYARGITLVTAPGETVEIGILDSHDIVAGSACACAVCMPLGEGKALVVTDHNFAELPIEEQIGMLGHECGHVYHNHLNLCTMRKDVSAEAQTLGNRYWDHEVAADDFGAELVGAEVMAKQLTHSEQLEAKHYETMGVPMAWENADGRKELLNRIARLRGESYERIEVGDLTRKLAALPTEELERRQRRVAEISEEFLEALMGLSADEMPAAMTEHQRRIAAIMAGEEE